MVLGGPQSVSLNNNQVWGNVSSNSFTVTGNISGNYGLSLTNAYTIYVPTAGTENGSDTTGSVNATTVTGATGSGNQPATFVLSGSNTYTSGTMIQGGTMMVNNTSGSGTGTGPVSVGRSATLVNNGGIDGDVTVDGAAGGSGTFAGAVIVDSGGAFNGAATINGALTVNAGGLVDVSSGTLVANGGVVNNGTVRLERGGSLAVGGATLTASGAVPRDGGGATFTNNGTLDVITGSFSAPAGFTNNGVVIDSSVVQAKSVSMAGGAVTVAIDGYTGHTYQLQVSRSMAPDSYTNVGPLQSGTTGSTLSFTDSNPNPQQGFYRVQVDP